MGVSRWEGGVKIEEIILPSSAQFIFFGIDLGAVLFLFVLIKICLNGMKMSKVLNLGFVVLCFFFNLM